MSSSSSAKSETKGKSAKPESKGSSKGSKPEAATKMNSAQLAFVQNMVVQGNIVVEKGRAILADHSLYFKLLEGKSTTGKGKGSGKAKKDKDPLHPSKPSIFMMWRELPGKKHPGKDGSKQSGVEFKAAKAANTQEYQDLEALYEERKQEHSVLVEVYNSAIKDQMPSEKVLKAYQEQLAAYKSNGSAAEDEDDEEAEEAEDSGSKKRKVEESAEQPAKKRQKTQA